MYSSSPSGHSVATSSGRSSPEHAPHPQQHSQRSNSSSFLPNFLFSTSTSSQTPMSDASSASLSHPPRRTSFGNHPFGAGSGRLSALSAFGFLSPSNGNTSSSAVSSSPPSHSATLTTIQASSSEPADATRSRPTSASGSQSTTKPPPPAKRHVCYPDGMGGTMCLEIKDRNRRGSSIV